MRLIKVSLIIAWFLLLGMLLHRDYFVRTLDIREVMALERDRRVEYQSIYFKEEKIGYVEHHFVPQDDNKLKITQQARMQLLISGQNHPVELDLEALLGSRSDLLSFEFSFNSPFYRMRADGTVDGHSVSFELDTGNSVVNDQVVLDGPPRLSTSRRSYLLSQDIGVGEKLKIPWFDPFSLTGTESVIEYRGKEKVLISDRVYNLHRFTENFGGARLNSWLDDDGLVIKEESPAGFVFIKEPEFKAKAMVNSAESRSDLLASVAVQVTGEMFDLTGRTEARYRISLPDDIEFDLNSNRQTFNDSDQVLTLVKEDLSSPGLDSAVCNAAQEQLRATPYIQSGAPEIIDQSLVVTQDLEDDLAKVQALADWVYTNLEKRPVIGIPDALTTLKAGIGDCNEHASLFAALSRAAGIPTTIAVGVVYHKQAFYYHAWNEVCVGGQWISLDTTTNQLPADLSHLKFIEGELQEQIKIGALINNLQIEPLDP